MRIIDRPPRRPIRTFSAAFRTLSSCQLTGNQAEYELLFPVNLVMLQTALLSTALLAVTSAMVLLLSTRGTFSTSLVASCATALGAAVGLWLASWMINGVSRLFWRELSLEQMSWIAAVTTIATTLSAYCGYALSLVD